MATDIGCRPVSAKKHASIVLDLTPIDKNVQKHRFSIKSFVQIYFVTFSEQ